jgi:hypothetical protein
MRYIFILSISLSTLTLNGQTELPTGKIEVIKDFEVRLTETKKIRIVPQPAPLDSSVRRYDYKLLAPSPSIEYLSPDIKPLAINPEQKPAYYPLFAKAGYGSPNSLLGALSYDHVQNESLQWGIDFDHLSANNKKIPLQKFSDSRGRIHAGYLLNESVQLDGYVDGHFEKHYFYGADPFPSNPDELKRTFNRYDVNIKISKVYSPSTNFRYSALFQYLFDKDNIGSRETGSRIGGEIGSALGEQGYPLGIKIIADISKLKHTEEHSISNYLVEPYFDYAIGDLKIHLAGIALLHKKENEVLPGIELRYGLFNDRMTIYAGWKGDVYKNNFHTLSEYNPYIHTRLDSLNNLISRRIYAGVTGSSGNLSYEVTGGYTKFHGMAFFLQDIDDDEQYNPVYDDGSYIGLEGSVRYGILKNVTLRARVSQKFFSLDNEEKPWHRPSFGLDGHIMYTGGSDEYHVSFIFHAENGLPYRTIGGTVDVLDALLDINLHGDYYITESIGAFAEINNILGNNRERWFTYPSFGFNAKAGILLRLP